MPKVKVVSGNTGSQTPLGETVRLDNTFGFDYKNPGDWYTGAVSNNPPPGVAREYDERQMPVDWDYRTAITGPNGEALPDKALGWNFHGQPDFGVGLGAWWNRSVWKFTQDNNEVSEKSRTLASLTEDVKATNEFWHAEQEAGNATRNKVQGQTILALVGSVAQAIGGAWRQLESAGPDSDGVTVWNAIPRAVGVAFDTLGLGFETLDRAVKENVVIPRAMVAERVLRSKGVSDETIDKWRDWVGPLGLFPLWARASLSMLTGGVHIDDLKATDKELLASRLGYTAWKEEATKEEFLRRVAEGSEDPRLLAMELQDPINEMAGEFLFDPTNYLGFAWKKLSTFAKDGRALAEAAQVGGDAKKLLTAVIEAADTPLREAAEGRFLQWADDLAEGTKLALSGEAREAGQWGGLRGMFSLTADSRQALLTEEMSDVFHELVVLTRSPDDTVRAITALSDVLNPSLPADARHAAMRLLNKSIGGRKVPLSSLFGERARRTALVWQMFMGSDEGKNLVKIMEDAGTDIVKMNETLGIELKKVTDSLFPTINDRIVNFEKYSQLIKDGKVDDAAELLKKHPYAKTPPNALHSNLLKIYEPLQNRFYKPVGNLQGTVFMGLNPAYRMRNRMGNFAVLFVDQGPGAAIMSLADNRFMPWGKTWAIDTLNNWSGDVGHAAEFRGIGGSAAGAAASFDGGKWMSGTLNYFARKASEDEAVAGVHIMSRAVRRVVKSVLNPKKALVGIEDVVKSPEDAKVIQQLSHTYHGDLIRAIQDFAGQKGIDRLENLLFLDDRQISKLDELGIGEAVRNALNPSLTPDEKIAHLDDIVESHRKLASRAAGESVIQHNPDLMDDIAFLEEGLGPEAGDLFNRQLAADRLYPDTAERAVDNQLGMLQRSITNKIVAEGRAAGIDEIEAAGVATDFASDIISRAKEGARRVIRGNSDEAYGPIVKGVKQEMDEFRNTAVKLRDDIPSMPQDQLVGAWEANSWWMGAVPAIEEVTQQSFRKALWTGYYNRARRKWHAGFQTQAQIYMSVFDDLMDAVDPDDVGKLTEHLRPIRETVERRGALSDNMYRAVIDEDGVAHMLVNPDELEDMIIEEWVSLNKLRPDRDPIKITDGTRTIRQYINELRLRSAAGDLDLEDIAGDPVIVQAMENVAGSRAERTAMLETLVSKRPDDLLTVDVLKARKDAYLAASPTETSVLNRLKAIDEEIDIIGEPPRTVEDLKIDDLVELPGEDFAGTVVDKYTTPSGQLKFQIRKDNGDLVRVNADTVAPSGVDLDSATKLDELRSEQKLLRDTLEADEFDLAVQEKIDELDARIAAIESKSTVDRLNEEISALPDPEPGMVRVYQGRPATFDASYDSPSWAKDVESAYNFGGDEGRYFYQDVPEEVWKAGIEPAVEAGVDRKFANSGLERHLPSNYINKGTELDGRPPRPVSRSYKRTVVAPMDDATPTPARMATHTSPEIKALVDHIKEQVQDGGAGGSIRLSDYSADDVKALRKWADNAQTRINEARSVAGQIASAERDFGLHNYGKRYGFDLVAGLIYPYQFWYSRSYAKWMKRLVQNPGVLSAYLRYRRTLEKLHAGMPEWWKYQLNTNELLGMDAKNPLYFNLEAMVNPLNGLTGVDFSDPERRKDWWGAAMEDIQKMGPSVWTPFTFALAAHYSFNGEKEAAARWAGRLLPQSRAFRDVTALVDPRGLGVEIDPYVQLFGGGKGIIGVGPNAGVESYERGRVARQLGMMLNERQFRAEDIIDAGYRQNGEIWDIARARAIHDRAGNLGLVTLPFLFGVGLKPRPQNDVQIDNLYNEMHTLIINRPNMSPDKYNEAWNQLRKAYPFMDAVLLSRKTGLARDEALAWNVINRIPPGQSLEFAKQVNLDYDILNKFRENKGDLSALTEAERFEFMGGVLQLDALLAIPDSVTASEWTEAKNAYSVMSAQGEEMFGEDIWQKVDLYYASYDENNQDAQRDFLRANPIVEQALNFKQMVINSTPILSTYYNSVEKMERFFKGQMYKTAEDVFGADLWNKWAVYHELRDMDETKAASHYFDDNPELKGYLELRDEVLPVIDSKVLQLGSMIDRPRGPFYRDENTMSFPEAQHFNADARTRWIDEQVQAYVTGQSQRFVDNVDSMSVIRTQADVIWPNTRKAADTYYNTVDKDQTQAAGILEDNPELAARIQWEFERVLRIALAREGELEASAAQFQNEIQQFGGAQEMSFENIAQGPLQRLLNDPEGLPPHLYALIQRNNQ